MCQPKHSGSGSLGRAFSHRRRRFLPIVFLQRGQYRDGRHPLGIAGKSPARWPQLESPSTFPCTSAGPAERCSFADALPAWIEDRGTQLRSPVPQPCRCPDSCDPARNSRQEFASVAAEARISRPTSGLFEPQQHRPKSPHTPLDCRGPPLAGEVPGSQVRKLQQQSFEAIPGMA